MHAQILECITLVSAPTMRLLAKSPSWTHMPTALLLDGENQRTSADKHADLQTADMVNHV